MDGHYRVHCAAWHKQQRLSWTQNQKTPVVCRVDARWEVAGDWGRWEGWGGARGHIRAAFTTAEWCIPLYTRAGQPSGLTDLKTTVYSTAKLQWGEELLSKRPPNIHRGHQLSPSVNQVTFICLKHAAWKHCVVACSSSGNRERAPLIGWTIFPSRHRAQMLYCCPNHSQNCFVLLTLFWPTLHVQSVVTVVQTDCRWM